VDWINLASDKVERRVSVKSVSKFYKSGGFLTEELLMSPLLRNFKSTARHRDKFRAGFLVVGAPISDKRDSL
jgi:hypothetical protein